MAIILRAIGLTCMLLVLEHHVHMNWWEGFLMGVGGMMVLGTLFDWSQ